MIIVSVILIVKIKKRMVEQFFQGFEFFNLGDRFFGGIKIFTTPGPAGNAERHGRVEPNAGRTEFN